MSKNTRGRRPYLPPVTRIELSEKNIRLRLILIVVLLAIAVVAIASGIRAWLTVEPGWQTVSGGSRETNCSSDFVLMYDYSAAGASAQSRQMQQLYVDGCISGYRIFSAEHQQAGLGNMAAVNGAVNQAVTVEPALYRALELVVRYDNRHVFLAPAAVEYNRLFLCQNDVEAVQYDPGRNEDIAAYLQTVADFASDPQMIRLELLGENRVQLLVAQPYLAFAEEYGITVFLDFGWMKNAFLADYLASLLREAGYTSGYIASYDGFTVNLDSRPLEYTQNLFDRQGQEISMPARLGYQGPASLVYLRDFPIADEDRWHYYAFEDGVVVTSCLDTADGLSRCACPMLLGISGDMGCGELLLQMAPLFVADSLDREAVAELADRGIAALWSEDAVLYAHESMTDLILLPESGGTAYSIVTYP